MLILGSYPSSMKNYSASFVNSTTICKFILWDIIYLSGSSLLYSFTHLCYSPVQFCSYLFYLFLLRRSSPRKLYWLSYSLNIQIWNVILLNMSHATVVYLDLDKEGFAMQPEDQQSLTKSSLHFIPPKVL